MDNSRVHFCYMDGVNALIGNYRWRYEVMTKMEMYHAIISLDKIGMTNFRFRVLGQPHWEYTNVASARFVIRMAEAISD